MFLRHITPQLLVESFNNLEGKRGGECGRSDVVGVREDPSPAGTRTAPANSCRDVLSEAVTAGVYTQSRWRQRPLGIASFEDKVVRQAAVTLADGKQEKDDLGLDRQPLRLQPAGRLLSLNGKGSVSTPVEGTVGGRRVIPPLTAIRLDYGDYAPVRIGE
ncbi:MAG: hypothetical protein JWQ87_946 [Candidatus Sulfotelmatobacter sp.]|nr:hypothetical protein [Candidatus Sulfotelmatobacter sp.]